MFVEILVDLEDQGSDPGLLVHSELNRIGPCSEAQMLAALMSTAISLATSQLLPSAKS